jgi:DNA-binding MarR family transcriptional regulator
VAKSFALLLRDAHLTVEAEVRRALMDAGFGEILPGHHVVLRNLGEDGARPSDIAAVAQVSRQAIAKVVDDLERRGVVRRDPDPDDGRGVIVRFTERGLAGLAVARTRMAAIEERIAADAGPRQWAAARTALEKLPDGSGLSARYQQR